MTPRLLALGDGALTLEFGDRIDPALNARVIAACDALATINLNADLGEGYGPWRMGDDDAMLVIVASANIACGGHAGDPDVMRRAVRAIDRELILLAPAASQLVAAGYDIVSLPAIAAQA